ncbi:DUF4255 domain-containing protein [Cyanobacteria bacterium FACHB-63]|nr:DUF4255 domain-containing protein [Cyanobacteria bacterium FACHB-63]
MLISVLQTLAEILAGSISRLTTTEQIDFSRPGSRRDESTGPTLNLYCYDIRESKQVQHSGRQVDRRLSDGRSQPVRVTWSPDWFDLSLIVTAWDRTALGEYHLLSEALSVLLRHRTLQEDFLPPEMRGYGNLSLTVASTPPLEIGALWSALTLPLRPALFLTIPIPFEPQNVVAPRVWERIFSFKEDLDRTAPTHQVLARQVTIAGIVKSAVTTLPIPEIRVQILDTDCITSTDQDGVFYFENTRNGTYVLNLQCPGYVSQNCNVLVDGRSSAFKDILLVPH